MKSVLNANLIKSNRWFQFMESTATALQISLIFLNIETGESICVSETCPVCHTLLPPFSPADKISAMDAYLKNSSAQEYSSDKYKSWESFGFQDDFLIIVRDHPCCCAEGSPSFHDRVNAANRLLNDFITILLEQWDDGRLAAELSTLRQMNHIVLSMFQGENNALDRALDLILSAAVILFDANGSWLEYSIGGQGQLLTKGDCAASLCNAAQKGGHTVTAEVESLKIQGRIGIDTPEDMERAATFLHFMAQECVIAVEIDYLMKLMESKLSLILGSIDSLVLLVDRRMNICYANEFAELLIGRSRMELIGFPVTNMPSPWNHCIIGLSRATKGIKDPFSSPLGERFVDWSVYRLEGNDDIPGWLVLADDRTDFYRLQEIGERAEKSANTSTLLGVLAHEIRNPLSTFRGLLQLIRLKKESNNIWEYIDLGIREVDRLSNMLNDFMLVSRPMDDTKGPIDLKSFLADMMPLLNGVNTGTPLKIRTCFHAVPPIQADPQQLNQVVLNLVRNACEAVKEQGEVSLILREITNEWVEIAVRDTGPGISPDAKDKIFQPFYSTKDGGTGLGLAISQTIIHNMGGEITARNCPEGGACFSVLLPTKAKKDKEYVKMDVLIITKDERMYLPLERVLKAENIKVKTIHSKDNALFLLNSYLPTVIVTDATLTNADYENIKKNYPAIQILIIGADEAMRGIEDPYYIPMPLNYAKFVYTIKFLINK